MSSLRRRRRLRAEATRAEQILWRALRSRRVGPKLRRQHPIGTYVVDFYCVAARLAIELDGGQHYDDEALAYDERRTRELAQSGVTVLRFTNTQVTEQTRAVVEEIARECERLSKAAPVA